MERSQEAEDFFAARDVLSDWDGVQLFRAVPVPSWVHDVASGQLLDGNDALLSLLGYTRAELCAISVSSLVAERGMDSDTGDARVSMQLRRKNGRTFRATVQERSFASDGGLRRMVASVLSTDAEPPHALMSGTDYRLPEDLAHVLERVSDGVIALDRNWIYTYINDEAAQLIGRPAEALLGRNIWTEFPEGVGQAFHVAYERAMRTGETIVLAEHFPSLNRWYENRIYPSADGLTIYFHDISGRKYAEGALRERELRLRTILETGPECVKVVAPDGQLHEMNPAGLALLEAESLEVVQQHGLPHFIVPEYRPAFAELMRNVLAGQQGVLEFEVIGLKGTRRWLETHAAPLHDSAGGPMLMLGITRDISGRKRADDERRLLEKQLRAAERLEAAGLLAGGVAHDFNNLLSVVNSTAELAMDGLDANDPLRNDLRVIRDAGDRAAVLTGQLLALSRTQPVTPETVGMVALLEKLRPMLVRVIREDIELRVGEAREELYVHADRGQIERVLLNLAVNARDAMCNGGLLDITVEAIAIQNEDANTVPLPAAGSYVLLTITDTGAGMTQSTIARIFEPFFTTKAYGRGTGLGLSASYEIVMQSGGAITVTSALGEGSTFRVYLPQVAHLAPVAGGDAQPPRPSRGTESILIVDDEAALARVVKRVLDAAGYNTLMATSAKEGLRLAEAMSGRLDLLFTDVVMPGMSGAELARRIIALHPEAGVLYTSGYYDDDVLRDAIQHRSATLLAKPYVPQELLRRVREVLDEVRTSSLDTAPIKTKTSV